MASSNSKILTSWDLLLAESIDIRRSFHLAPRPRLQLVQMNSTTTSPETKHFILLPAATPSGWRLVAWNNASEAQQQAQGGRAEGRDFHNWQITTQEREKDRIAIPGMCYQWIHRARRLQPARGFRADLAVKASVDGTAGFIVGWPWTGDDDDDVRRRSFGLACSLFTCHHLTVLYCIALTDFGDVESIEFGRPLCSNHAGKLLNPEHR